MFALKYILLTDALPLSRDIAIAGIHGVKNAFQSIVDVRSTKESEDIIYELKCLDLIATFDVIHGIMLDMPDKCYIHSVDVAMKNVHDHTIYIEHELMEIHRLLEQYHRSWFKTFTFFNLRHDQLGEMKDKVKGIQMYKKQLDSRLELLLRIVSAVDVSSLNRNTLRIKENGDNCLRDCET